MISYKTPLNKTISYHIPYYMKRRTAKRQSCLNCSFLFDSVFFVELIYTSASLSCFLLTCVEWMTFRADFYVDIFFCRTCHKCVSTVTCYSCLMVIWMYSFSHDFHLVILYFSFTRGPMPSQVVLQPVAACMYCLF